MKLNQLEPDTESTRLEEPLHIGVTLKSPTIQKAKKGGDVQEETKESHEETKDSHYPP